MCMWYWALYSFISFPWHTLAKIDEIMRKLLTCSWGWNEDDINPIESQRVEHRNIHNATFTTCTILFLQYQINSATILKASQSTCYIKKNKILVGKQQWPNHALFVHHWKLTFAKHSNIDICNQIDASWIDRKSFWNGNFSWVAQVSYLVSFVRLAWLLLTEMTWAERLVNKADLRQ